MGEAVDEWSRLVKEAEELAAAEAVREWFDQAELMTADTPPPEANIKNILNNLTEEEMAIARKQALLRQYGYVEGGPEDEDLTREGPPRVDSAKTSAEKKAADERRSLIEAALKLDGKKKKYKKQQESEHLVGGRSSLLSA